MELQEFAPDFELPSITGEVVHLTALLQQHQVVAVIFMCNHCPYVKAYIPRLIALQREFAERNVIFVGINANDDRNYPEDSYEKMQFYAHEWGLNFPYLRDRNQEVAQSFGAVCTPEPFVLDRQGQLRYHGAIDDNHRDAAAVTRQDLREAIACILADQEFPRPITPAIGCSVKWMA